jgi:hypothetical protein
MLIYPKIRKKLARHAEMANTCCAIPSGSGIFEVHDREWEFVVNITGRHCTCKRWDLIGIPYSQLGKMLVAHTLNHLCMKRSQEGQLKLEGNQHMKLVDQMGQD